MKATTTKQQPRIEAVEAVLLATAVDVGIFTVVLYLGAKEQQSGPVASIVMGYYSFEFLAGRLLVRSVPVLIVVFTLWIDGC